MIGRLRGRLVAQEPDRVLLETGAGVGYEVLIPPRALTELPGVGEEVTLHVHTQVREDAITLYGFTEDADKRCFRVVQGVTGIGPKLALAIVGSISPGALADAIAMEDILGLTRIPGLGAKTGARLCLELKDKLGKLLPPPTVVGGVPLEAPSTDLRPAVADAIGALSALGYTRREIDKAMKAAAATDDDTVQSLLKRALKALSPG